MINANTTQNFQDEKLASVVWRIEEMAKLMMMVKTCFMLFSFHDVQAERLDGGSLALVLVLQ